MVRTCQRMFAVALVLAASCGRATSGDRVTQASSGAVTFDATGRVVSWTQQFDVAEFEQRMRSAFGSRFAYVWISGERLISVGIVNPSPCEREVVSQLASVYGAVGTVAPERYSAIDLDRFAARVNRALFGASTNVGVTYGIDPTTNSLTVVLAAKDQRAIEQLRRAVPADALDLRIEPGFRFEEVPASLSGF
jgi:hypothetical protein